MSFAPRVGFAVVGMCLVGFLSSGLLLSCSESTSCAEGEATCGNLCVDTQSDVEHCGGCGRACAPGERCSAGACALTCGGSTPTVCGDACVDTRRDRLHCGSCATACAAGEICLDGHCELSCGGSTPTRCGDACVDTLTDREFCGDCETACDPGEVCSAGICAPFCSAGRVDCAGYCADLTSDPAHCGGCGFACAGGGSAVCVEVGGLPSCVCNPGWVGNGWTCIDVDECQEGSDNCNANANCANTDGSFLCACKNGWEGDGLSCTNVDECATGQHTCDLAITTCVDTQGSYECECTRFGVEVDGACLNPATVVADVSDRPIKIEIASAGTFWVAGMGRVAAEMTYVSALGTTGSGLPRLEHTPTGWLVHDIVLRGISPADGSSLVDLLTLLDSGNYLDASIHLDGLGQEWMRLNVFGLEVVREDRTVTSGSMAELVLSATDFDVADYDLPYETSFAPDNIELEIAGVGSYSMPITHLAQAAIDSSDTLVMRSVGLIGLRNHFDSPASAMTLAEWLESNTRFFDEFGDFERRTTSQVYFDVQANEILRVNCFETFPSEIYFFNPAKPYGETYLFDAVIPTEYCEEG